MKYTTLILSSLAGIMVATLVYLSGAFYNADFNIVNWSQLSRGIIAIFGLGFGSMVFIVPFSFMDQK